MRIRALITLLGLVILAGCSSDPWDDFPYATPPDRQCRTGHEAGHDIYLWDCVSGTHIAVFQFCAGMTGCRDPEKQTRPCGELTPIETEAADELSACTPPPPDRRWP